MSKIANDILSAIDIVVDKKISETPYTKTIIAEVTGVIDSLNHKYAIKYQDSALEAFAVGGNEYLVGQLVYVLVENGALDSTKYILNKVVESAPKAVSSSQRYINYRIIGENVASCDTLIFAQGYYTLYDKNRADNQISINQEALKAYIANGTSLLISADFKTILPLVDSRGNTVKHSGNYGLKFELCFSKGNETFIENLILDVSAMNGNPYYYMEFTNQKKNFDEINIENFISVNKVIFFAEGFESADVRECFSIRNLKLEVGVLLGAAKGDIDLDIIARDGNIFQDAITNLNFTAVLKNKGIELTNTNATFKWFRENPLVAPGSSLYHPHGGSGWELLTSNRADISISIDLVKVNQQKFKCVATFKGEQYSEEIDILNENPEFTLALDISGTPKAPILTCLVDSTSILFDYQWISIDPFGTYLLLDKDNSYSIVDIEKIFNYNIYKCAIIYRGEYYGCVSKKIDGVLKFDTTLVAVYIEYCNGASIDTPPSDEANWTTETPTQRSGEYLWQRTISQYTDGSEQKTYTCLAGAAGKSVVATEKEYYCSISATDQIGGVWQKEVPELSKEYWRWSREVLHWSDNSTTYGAPRIDEAEDRLVDWSAQENKLYIDGSKLYANSVTARAISQTYKDEVTNQIDKSTTAIEQKFTVANGKLESKISETQTDLDGFKTTTESKFEQLPDEISAQVTESTKGKLDAEASSTGMSWSLKADKWSINSIKGDTTTEVLAVDENGLAVKGDITANNLYLSGKIYDTNNIETGIVTSIIYKYAVNESATEPPAELEFSYNMPSRQEGQYIWERSEETRITNGQTTTTTVTKCITGDKGDKGEDAVAPEVKIENGYWIINGKSTGVKAEGEDGEPGQTPTIDISTDGYWVINGVKSEVKAKGEDGKSGSDGVSVTEIINYYFASSLTTGITINTSGWETDVTQAQVNKDAKYLWNYEKIKYSNGTESNTDPTIIGNYAADGENGDDGRGIVSIVEYYYTNDSTTAPTFNINDWSTTPLTPTSSEKYLWNVEVINYTSGNPTITNPAMIGSLGEDGQPGAPGGKGDPGSGIKKINSTRNLSLAEWQEYSRQSTLEWTGLSTTQGIVIGDTVYMTGTVSDREISSGVKAEAALYGIATAVTTTSITVTPSYLILGGEKGKDGKTPQKGTDYFDGQPGASITSVEDYYTYVAKGGTPPATNDNNIGDSNTSKWVKITGSLPILKNYLRYRAQRYIYSNGNKTWSNAWLDMTEQAVIDWCKEGATTYIDGANLYAGSVTAEKVTTDIVKSVDYNGVTDGSVFSTKGSFLNLANGSFTTPNFRINTSGNAYFNGEVTATKLTITSNTQIEDSKNYFATSDNLTTVSGVANEAKGAASSAQEKADSAYGLANTANTTANNLSFVNSWRYAETAGATTIKGGTVYTDKIRADQIAVSAIQSANYKRDNNTNTGMLINLSDGSIDAPKFKIGSDGSAIFAGELSAPSGNIGGFTITTGNGFHWENPDNPNNNYVNISADGIEYDGDSGRTTIDGTGIYVEESITAGTLTTIGNFWDVDSSRMRFFAGGNLPCAMLAIKGTNVGNCDTNHYLQMHGNWLIPSTMYGSETDMPTLAEGQIYFVLE